MTQAQYARIRGLKTLILYHLSKVTMSPSRQLTVPEAKGGSCLRPSMSNNTHTTEEVVRHETQQT
jgi:hypothetical protein